MKYFMEFLRLQFIVSEILGEKTLTKCTKAEKNEAPCGKAIGKTLTEKASLDSEGLEIKFTSDQSLKCQNFIQPKLDLVIFTVTKLSTKGNKQFVW